MRIYIGNNYRGRLTNHQIIPAGKYDSERLNSQFPGLADYLIISGVAVPCLEQVDTPDKGVVEISATPAAIELAEQHGIDLATIAGTGADGKILKGDVQATIDNLPVSHDKAVELYEERKKATGG
jgi:hypothetical protein